MGKRMAWIRKENEAFWDKMTNSKVASEWLNKKIKEDKDNGIIPEHYMWSDEQQKWVDPNDK